MPDRLPLFPAGSPYLNAGKEVSGDWTNRSFPRGSVVSFKYRELSVDQIPKEARYFRKRADSIKTLS